MLSCARHVYILHLEMSLSPPYCMCLLSHHATFIHCSNSVWGLSNECVSSENSQIFTSGASFLALSALAYCCASTSGTLQIKQTLHGLQLSPHVHDQ